MKHTRKNLILDKRLTKEIDRYVGMVIVFIISLFIFLVVISFLIGNYKGYAQAVDDCVKNTSYSKEYCEYIAR